MIDFGMVSMYMANLSDNEISAEIELMMPSLLVSNIEHLQVLIAICRQIEALGDRQAGIGSVYLGMPALLSMPDDDGECVGLGLSHQQFNLFNIEIEDGDVIDAQFAGQTWYIGSHDEMVDLQSLLQDAILEWRRGRWIISGCKKS